MIFDLAKSSNALRNNTDEQIYSKIKSTISAEFFSVSFDDHEIKLIIPGGYAHTIPWNELSSVAQETTNEGPFMDDVFWILSTKKHSLRVPQGARGEKELLGRLQPLPNFDNKAVISAMGCIENKLFLCWQSGNEKDSH